MKLTIHLHLMPMLSMSGVLDFKLRRVLYVVCFLLGNTPVSEVYMLTFRNTLFYLHRQVDVSSL